MVGRTCCTEDRWTPWTDNIFAPSPAWGIGGTATNPNYGSQPGGLYGSFSVSWSGPVRAMPAYVHMSPENTRSAVRRVREDLLRDNCTELMQSLSTSRSILRDCLANWRDCDWDNLWDELIDQ